MEAGREQRMIEIDRSPSQFALKSAGFRWLLVAFALGFIRCGGGLRRHEEGLRLLDFGSSRFVIFRVTSSCV
jgi:hypothetical protein